MAPALWLRLHALDMGWGPKATTQQASSGYAADMMMLIYMKDGQCIELEGAAFASRVDKELLCYSQRGAEVSSFPALEVEAYTTNPEVAANLREEVCEDLTVVPAGAGPAPTESCS